MFVSDATTSCPPSPFSSGMICIFSLSFCSRVNRHHQTGTLECLHLGNSQPVGQAVRVLTASLSGNTYIFSALGKGPNYPLCLLRTCLLVGQESTAIPLSGNRDTEDLREMTFSKLIKFIATVHPCFFGRDMIKNASGRCPQ